MYECPEAPEMEKKLVCLLTHLGLVLHIIKTDLISLIMNICSTNLIILQAHGETPK